jgi:hypothetical protein
MFWRNRILHYGSSRFGAVNKVIDGSRIKRLGKLFCGLARDRLFAGNHCAYCIEATFARTF